MLSMSRKDRENKILMPVFYGLPLAPYALSRGAFCIADTHRYDGPYGRPETACSAKEASVRVHAVQHIDK